MPDLVPTSLLMTPVRYQGEDYFTSQFFHRQYLANSASGGKYRRHPDFARLLRSIEAYQIYVAQGDIVEIQWIDVVAEVKPNLLYLKPLFQAAGFHQLTLLNATAQVALTHHLDDELSLQLSVAVNTATARQMTRSSLGTSTPLELATRDISAWMEAAKLFATPTYIAQQEGVKMIAATHGVDFRPLLLSAPAQDRIAPDEEMLEVTEIAKLFGLKSGLSVNQALYALGWQKPLAVGWEPIGDGIQHSARHAWTFGNKTGLNWKWRVSALRRALNLGQQS